MSNLISSFVIGLPIGVSKKDNAGYPASPTSIPSSSPCLYRIYMREF